MKSLNEAKTVTMTEIFNIVESTDLTDSEAIDTNRSALHDRIYSEHTDMEEVRVLCMNTNWAFNDAISSQGLDNV